MLMRVTRALLQLLLYRFRIKEPTHGFKEKKRQILHLKEEQIEEGKSKKVGQATKLVNSN